MPAHVAQERDPPRANATPAAADRAPPAAAGLQRGPLTPATLLALQRSVGNAAATRLATAAPARRLQRHCGGDCGCATCSEKLDAPSPQDAGRNRKVKSVRKGERCDPARTIQGTVFVPWRDEEIAVARKAVDGSTKALAKQNIVLDFDIRPFLELDDLNITDRDTELRTVSSYGQVCAMLRQLAPMRTKPGVVVLVVPISGEICGSHGAACYVPDLDDRCGPSMPSVLSTPPSRVIIVGRFMQESQLAEVLAHELGHHAGRPQRGDPALWDHEPYDPHNYMGFGADRDHYRSELLDRMCKVSFQF
ncbi:MAG TPA: hypothetical protein VII98_08745 [Solirubrobacteraceae bacterium]